MNEFNNKENNVPGGESSVPENYGAVSSASDNNGGIFSEGGTYHGVNKEGSVEETNVSEEKTASVNCSQKETVHSEQPVRNENYSRVYPQENAAYGRPASQTWAGNNQVYSNMSAPSKPSKSYAYPEPGTAEKGKKSKGGLIFGILAGIALAFLAGVLAFVIVTDVLSGGIINDYTDNTDVLPENYEEIVTEQSPVLGTVDSEGQLIPKGVYEKILPSSVGILIYDNSKNLATEGTGVFFMESDDGKYTYIITCAHVIAGDVGYIRVQTSDGKEFSADIVGFDAKTDIGVIRIEENGFVLAEIGDSSSLCVGDPVYAIGNPGGVEFANSFTNGMVSALDRPVNSSDTGYTTDCIQHTAAINPGNSGGALVNSFGQVIGINSMKIVADEYEGMGFAVPSSVFTKIVNEIMKNGYVANRPKIGITYIPASEYSSYGMFIALKDLPSGSIVIYEISEDSSLVGTKAKVGDMIIAVNGTSLDKTSDLTDLIENSEVGDTLTLTLIRIYEDYSYDEFDVLVTLVEDRGDTFITQNDNSSSNNGGYGNYDEYYDEYFNDFFNDYFGR